MVIFALLALCSAARSDEIHDAAKVGDAEKVRELLKANPELVNAKDKEQKTPLHFAVETDQKKVAELLIANGADVNAKYQSWIKHAPGFTPLHDASFEGHKE